ncbi:hypothetical protein DFR69_112180 [Nocardia neocaledoniensis]|uniref:Cytochrome P450 n=2 Tax=Nocardia neocaledoniensis TaxID=236511 RepID=A0A317N6I6_9NOCA|nr:hypothetical protein DFR69_112180 [Nocardia neocaledoniensis]
MPPVPEAVPGETDIRWLRSQVPRFRDGAEHHRRRAAVQRELDRLDPELLRTSARARAGRPLAHVRTLLAALDLPESAADSVALVAAAYQPHQPITEAADAAVTELVTLCRTAIRREYGNSADTPGQANDTRDSHPHRAGPATTHSHHHPACDSTSPDHGNRASRTDSDSIGDCDCSGTSPDSDSHSDGGVVALICVLVQACGATAELIAAARAFDRAPIAERPARIMADAPPLRSTRRMVNGVATELDLRHPGLGFGAGPHRCPGAEHALAIASGVLEGEAGTDQ